MKKYFIFLFLLSSINLSFAQTDSTKATSEELNFEEFGDADNKDIRTFCTQKVSYLSPTKLISIGYEAQLPFHLSSENATKSSITSSHVNSFSGFRLGLNTPIISRSNFILNLGLNFWNTSAKLEKPENSNFYGGIRALNSTGINATVFKPFDNKHFMIIQANADLNGNYRGFNELDAKGMTYSGTAIYGWKKNDNLMWGVGVTRTYRAGQLLHIPVILLNRTFNQKWGIETILPAKFNVRRNFSPSSYLLFGYEIEGNTYFVANTGSDLYLRRGEMKPRVTFEKKIAGFVWLSAQAGWRYNWRFDGFSTKNPIKNEKPIIANGLGNPLYFNLSINLVSP
jgi:Domain of unknown function (DUF6268)